MNLIKYDDYAVREEVGDLMTEKYRKQLIPIKRAIQRLVNKLNPDRKTKVDVKLKVILRQVELPKR